eukprot:TRINITY_DN9137_c0_g1_i1.p1 TRINITY_DN9137_c0_g1~~TRINITY_DN9137_c0_g1_i1.p1  ORF type:complete len:210 (+),score=35.01 TRINITY_DN9137_c0_g1_i1:65-631(+)
MGEDNCHVITPLKVCNSAAGVKKMLAINEYINSRARLAYTVSDPKCYVRYEVCMVEADKIEVTFFCSGQYTHVSTTVVDTCRPVCEVRWVSGTINGMWPSARVLLQAGIEESDLSVHRYFLLIKLDPPPAMKGARKPGDEFREIYLSFGVSHLGYVIDIRPSSSRTTNQSLKATCHRFSEWTPSSVPK